MINYNQFKKIKELQQIGTSQNKISSKLGIPLGSIRNWWHRAESDFLALEVKRTPSMEPYEAFILDVLKICPQIRQTNLLYKLQDHFPDFKVAESTFYRFVRALREKHGLTQFTKRLTTARGSTAPGEEAQADFGQMNLKSMYGNKVTVYFFCMTLNYSNFRFMHFEPKPFTTETAIAAHNYAFKFFGNSRPHKILYDLDNVFAHAENYGDIIYVEKFLAYTKSIGFQIVTCHAYDPQSKSVVENSIKKVKYDLLMGMQYCGIQSLNIAVLRWLDTSGNEFVSGSRRGIPKELFKEEQKHLIPVAGNLLQDKQRIFSNLGNNTVKYSGKEYELPLGTNLIMKQVQVEESSGDIIIYCTTTGDEICRHKVSIDPHEFVVKLNQPEQELVQVNKIRRKFKDNELFERFFARLKVQTPRYLAKQSMAILKATQHYTTDQLHEAFLHCIKVDVCTFTQIMAFLIAKHGTEIAKTFLSKIKLQHYIKVAKSVEVSCDDE